MAKVTQEELFKLPPHIVEAKKTNPMLRFGFGPEGKKCKTCDYLWRKEFANVYYKCAFMLKSDNTGPDHRVNWAACAKYKENING